MPSLLPVFLSLPFKYLPLIEDDKKETNEESESSSNKPSQKNDQTARKQRKIMGTCKNIGITVFGPLLDYGLYYYDLFSDTVFTYTMLNNCHFKYFATSICIMVSSYFVTVAYLRYHVQESWKKSFMYPYHHGRNLFNQMKNNTYGNTGCRVFLWGVQN